MPRYKFSEIAINVTDKRMPVSEDKALYIAPNNLDTDTLSVPTYGYKVDLKGSKLIMHKGDMLFGRREPQLKHAAIAPHDGLFSAHGMIFHPKENVISKEFFPFFISSDYFFDEAIRIAVGSLSPTVNWKDLKDLEFEIPDLATQEQLAKVLWGIIRSKLAYKKLIEKTDELVKSQFIEMFGDPSCNPYQFPKQQLSELAEIMSGITKGRKTKSTSLRKVPYICTANVQNGHIDWTEVKHIEATDEEIQKYAIQDQDVLIIEGGDADKVGRGCIIHEFPAECIYQNHVFRIRVNKQLITPKFLSAYLLLSSTKEYFLHCAKQTTGIATINKKQISQLEVMYPTLDKQNLYVDFVEQTDKSKFAAKQALADLTAAQKALMRQYLG